MNAPLLLMAAFALPFGAVSADWAGPVPERGAGQELLEIPFESPRHDDQALQAATDFLEPNGSFPAGIVAVTYSRSKSEGRSDISSEQLRALVAHYSDPYATTAMYKAAGKTGVMVIWQKCDDGREGMSVLFQLNQGKLARVDASGWITPLPPAPPSMPTRAGSN